MQLDVTEYKIRFRYVFTPFWSLNLQFCPHRDSLNYVPATLDGFGKAFGVPVSKGKFPHRTNEQKFWNTVTPWPDKDAYGFEDVPNKKRKAFNKWFYKERRKYKSKFDFNRQFVE